MHETAICLHCIEYITIYFAVTDQLLVTFVGIKFGERDPFKLTQFLNLSVNHIK